MLTRERPNLAFDIAWLVRLPNCAAAAAGTLLGAYLAGGSGSVATRPAVMASLAAALIHAAANVLNDLVDVPVDQLNRPARPLPSGRVSPLGATTLAVVTGATGLAVAASLGTMLAGLAAVLALMSVAYCWRLKDSVLAGNATVALLACSTIAYGALAVGNLNKAVGAAAALTFLYMLAFEVLKSIEDREADAIAGIRTVAVLGLRPSLRIFHVVVGAFAAGAVSPWLAGFASRSYLVAIVLAAVVPLLVAAALLGRHASVRSTHVAWAITKAAWPLGLASMGLLR